MDVEVNLAGYAVGSEHIERRLDRPARGASASRPVLIPSDGLPEDPATGSANCALAGMLSHYASKPTGLFSWRIAQGVEMGRPSTLHARAEKREGKVVSTRIGGACVLVGEGFIHLD